MNSDSPDAFALLGLPEYYLHKHEVTGAKKHFFLKNLGGTGLHYCIR